MNKVAAIIVGLLFLAGASLGAEMKNIVLIAGSASHGGGEHEHPGGCFELDWSVNPSWDAEIRSLPRHPITRGVSPFKIYDEWYFHMRFVDGLHGVVPILSAVAPPSTMDRPDGPHEGNRAVRESVKRGDPQHLAWAFERPDGGRGFGFTGGHFYRNWGNDNFRKVVLNAILWTAKIEVPLGGVSCQVTAEDLKKNVQPKPR